MFVFPHLRTCDWLTHRIQVDWGSTEFCYTPIIQSRSTNTGYDLRSTSVSSSDPIAHKGVILIAVGMRYKSYCANLGRSVIVDPSKVTFTRSSSVLLLDRSQEQEEVYNTLVSLQSELVREMKDGVTARDVYHRALEYIKEKKPELEKHFVKNVGSAVRIIIHRASLYTHLK